MIDDLRFEKQNPGGIANDVSHGVKEKNYELPGV
jgi:hypothetical protein